MSIVSVTRFRARSIFVVPLFALHANRAIAQVRKAEGFLTGAVQRQDDGAFWTMTAWRDERSLQAYVASGSHRAAMPHLRDWGVEASVVRWSQETTDLPDWSEAARRMRVEGRPSRLRHPGPDHSALSYAEPVTGHGMRL